MASVNDISDKLTVLERETCRAVAKLESRDPAQARFYLQTIIEIRVSGEVLDEATRMLKRLKG